MYIVPGSAVVVVVVVVVDVDVVEDGPISNPCVTTLTMPMPGDCK